MNQDIPFILVTGHRFEMTYPEDMNTLGIVSFFGKPVDFVQLQRNMTILLFAGASAVRKEKNF